MEGENRSAALLIEGVPTNGGSNVSAKGPAAAPARVHEVVVERGIEEPRASARAITLNLITGGFGIGIFSLPWSTAGASLIPAVVLVVLVVCLNGFTVSILIEGAEKHQAFDLGSLLSHLPPHFSKAAQATTNVAVWVVLFVTQVGYVNVMADAVLGAFGETFITIGLGSDGARNLAVVLVSMFVLPLCFLDQRYLNFTSAIAVIVNVYIFAILLGEPARPSTVPICYLGAGRGSVAMVSVMMNAVVVQMCVLPMYHELEDRSPKKFNKMVAIAFGTLIVIFCAFAVLGYVTYGQSVVDNILDALPRGKVGRGPWGEAARIGAGICVAGVYPIFEQAMVAPVWNSHLQNKRLLYFGATVTTVGLIMLAAIRFKSIGFINVIDGAICCAAFVSVCPGVVGLCLLDRQSRRWRTAMYTLIVFGVVAGALGMALQDNYQEDISQDCVWSSSN